jgi:RsiW-degrading membrane proteinase PrsW (M82 family)
MSDLIGVEGGLVPCPHCGEPVPPGGYCGTCGGHLGDAAQASRRFAYAAASHESVHRAALVSTLFPHLPHRHAHVFREMLGGGLAVVILLAALRLYTPAAVVAAILLPVLYVLYLYEVEVYQHEPALVLVVTFVAGIALGVAYSLVVDRLAGSLALGGTDAGPLVTAVLLPVVMQVLMVLGPLLLLSHAHFDETLDGLTFGVATALGFTMAMVVAGEWHVLTTSLRGTGVPTDSMLRIVREGIVAAVVNATTTGLITATLWQRRHRRAAGRHASTWRALPASAVLAFAVQIGLGLASYFIRDLLLEVVVWVVVAALLLVWLRVVLHHALLDEGAEHHIGPASVCAECHHVVPLMRFCPVCGTARSASPKHMRTDAAARPEATG